MDLHQGSRACPTFLKLLSKYTTWIMVTKWIYLDFCKAFDSVPHSRLLIKLQSFAIAGNTLKIIENFLANRWMAVRVGDSHASWRPVLSGVPQGSKINDRTSSGILCPGVVTTSAVWKLENYNGFGKLPTKVYEAD